MKIAGVLPVIFLVLCAIECSVSAFRRKGKDFARKIQNDGSFFNEDPGILENIEKAVDPCGDVWTKFEEYCYHVGAKIMTEEQAQQYCDQEMDANLAKINSKEENNFVLDVAKRHAPSAKKVWIGMKWVNSARNYYWYDNSVPTFTNWAPGEPNGKVKEPCVAMYIGQYELLPVKAAGYWNDEVCDAPHIAAVCKRLY
ncbi:lithostathine-1-like [Acropora muricata]|uniref:lithostathine-1-like n=1 Tax=Acropora muricata TaxID=159855 RepID=UPI0034E5E9FA